ncbi:RNA-binding protein, putative [Plasmodium chabaudi chabaudi]|uniref:RNA-binding protein, putative n=1 Tax=Plasmodium chabaudi chabaudi TaxID=31271 RepID=A0A1D3LFR5_PLACU|nr:RNA-binding protein, putative [Plasmodium chabaudi chabaudi]
MTKKYKNDSPIDKHKVFVRNIRENDVKELTERFEKECKKHFFFKSKSSSTKSAICIFHNEEDATNFITKYNNSNDFSTKIMCEFAIKKRHNEKVLTSILYNRKKIKYSNSIKIYTNCDIDNITILNYLKNIYFMKKDVLLKCENDQSKSLEYKNKINTNNDNHSDEEIEIVASSEKDKKFEDMVINIEKTSNINKSIILKKINNANFKGNKKDESKNYFGYVAEFANYKLASTFYQLINKNEFQNYLKNNNKNGDYEHVFFLHELCLLNTGHKMIIIKNLNAKCHTENIQKLFKNIETNPKIHIPKKNDKKQGYAFVTFSNHKNAKKALLLTGTILCGNKINIEKYNKEIKPFNDKTSKDTEDLSNDSVDDYNNYPNEDQESDDEDVDTKSDESSSSIDDNNSDEEVASLSKKRKLNDSNQKDDKDNNKKKRKMKNNEKRDYKKDAEEGKTIFITNIPTETTNEEIKEYIEKNISKDYTYIKTCRNDYKKISVFVKLTRKIDADNFLKKIGEYNEEDEQISESENVIDQFYNNANKKKKEKLKKILLNEDSNLKHTDILFFKNNYLMIKRAVPNDIIKDKKKLPTDKKEKKKKNKLRNNIHLINDNYVNNENIPSNVLLRNKKLLDKKTKLLKDSNFVINPCRLYVRNYPLAVEQNTFRRLIAKHFTPIFIKKFSLKRKAAFKKANEVITKMKLMKDNTSNKDLVQDGKVGPTIRNKDSNNANTMDDGAKKNVICFLDINKHEYAKQIISLLQNKNMYDLINQIFSKKDIPTIKTNKKPKNILYVDYCIENLRMLHIKKMKEEKFKNRLKQTNQNNLSTKKVITKKPKKMSRGLRQREKRRLLKAQNENKNITNTINPTTADQKDNSLKKEKHKKRVTFLDHPNDEEINNTDKKKNKKNKNKNKNKKSNVQDSGETKKKVKAVKSIMKKDTSKADNNIESIQKDVLNFLKTTQ